MTRTIETQTWGGKRLAFRDVTKHNGEDTPLEIILEPGTQGGVLVYRKDAVRLRDMLDKMLAEPVVPTIREQVDALELGDKFTVPDSAGSVFVKLQSGRIWSDYEGGCLVHMDTQAGTWTSTRALIEVL